MIKYDDNLAKQYNTFHKNQYEKLQILKIKNYLKLNKKTNIVDCGCGSGRLLVPLSNYVNQIIGVEKSWEMLRNLKTNNNNHIIYNDNMNNWKNYDEIIKSDTFLFSMTLHQINESKKEQIKLINDLLNNKNTKSILIITVNENQFDDSIINKIFKKSDSFDRKRFLTVNEYKKHFNCIKLIEVENQYVTIKRDFLINMIKNKYISSLQILTDKELNNGINVLTTMYPDDIIYGDYYTYILLNKD